MAKELVTDELWEIIEPLLPEEPPKSEGGRPRVDDRTPLPLLHADISAVPHRERKFGGYVFGAFIPATGEALTATYTSRSITTFAKFLEKVEEWVPEGVGRLYAIMDNLRAHKAYDVLLFSRAHPRWEFVFQPKYAAYLNLIEPWWKTLKSLAIKGRFLETWE